MKKNLSVGIGTLLVMLSAVTVLGQNETNPSRLKAEETIRSVIYESTLAALTADIKAYKKYAAPRMLNLYKLTYEELIKDREMRKIFSQTWIKGWEDFMASRVRQSAIRFARLSRVQIEQLARREADGPITFLSEKEAKIRGVRVVLEDNKWKTDASEAIKLGLLQDPNNRLGQASRAKIEKF
jgi:hypothetical protein